LASAPLLNRLTWPDARRVHTDHGWSQAWDQAVLEAALARWDRDYDPKAFLLGSHRGPEYNYQSGLRNIVVHPTRESLEYALLLLESGETFRRERALNILDRDLQLQETDPNSRWCGVWPYYLEEPLAQMSAADLNWADFNGAQLLVIVLRHQDQLPAALLQRMREAIRLAALAIKRRDVTPYYTNIAVQGSFVTLASAELLDDPEIGSYAIARLRRFAATVDESGSFAEYNSPTYMHVTLENLTRILTFVRNSEARALSERLHERAWLHLAMHWHSPTRQFAGPMSRAYSNDVGSPLWLQKALNNELAFVTLDEIRAKPPSGNGDVIILPYSCPESLRSRFLHFTGAHQHREVFISGQRLVDNLKVSTKAVPMLPIEGTTFLTSAFSLGSANRSDFWVQRRPLIAYWGGDQRPPQCMQLRAIKDDYDFASGLFYSAHDSGCVLGAIAFRSNGGDKHPSLDPVRNGTFTAKRIYAQFLFPVWADAWQVLSDGKPVQDLKADLPLSARISIDMGTCRMCVQVRKANFGGFRPKVVFVRQDGQARLELILFEAAEEQTLHWSDMNDAGCSFTLVMDDRPSSLRQFDRRCSSSSFTSSPVEDYTRLRWRSPSKPLEVTVRRGVHPVAEMDAAYDERVSGEPAPMERLSDEKILG
jgi:hypothetical protein